LHQIVQRLGLRLRPYWGSSERFPNPLAGKGRERRGREGRGGEGNRKGRKGKRGEFIASS